MKASVQEVRGLTDQRDQLTNQGQIQERAMTELNYKLSQEVASRKVAQEKLEQTKEATEELRKKKVIGISFLFPVLSNQKHEDQVFIILN